MRGVGARLGKAVRRAGAQPVRWIGVLAVIVVAVLLAGIGTAAVWRAHSLRSSGAAQNTAHVDVDTTPEVRSAVTRVVNRVLTYRYDDVAATARAADDLLRGRAHEEYRRLIEQVGAHAPRQRLTMTTRVVEAGVLSLVGDRADVLVFADQTAGRGDEEPSGAATQLLVTAERVEDRWVVTSLTPR